jgi:hypothetical protein
MSAAFPPRLFRDARLVGGRIPCLPFDGNTTGGLSPELTLLLLALTASVCLGTEMCGVRLTPPRCSYCSSSARALLCQTIRKKKKKNEVSESPKISNFGPHAKLIRILLGKIALRGHLKAFAYPPTGRVFFQLNSKSMKIQEKPMKTALIVRIWLKIAQKVLHLFPKSRGFGSKLRKRCYIFSPNPAGLAPELRKRCYIFSANPAGLAPKLRKRCYISLRCYIFCPTFQRGPKTTPCVFEGRDEDGVLQKKLCTSFFAEKM